MDNSPMNDPHSWVRNFFAVVDERAPDMFDRFFTEDSSFRFGNGETVRGRENIREHAATINALSERYDHEILGIWIGRDGESDVLSVELEVTYLLAGGVRVTIPGTSTLRLRGPLIKDYRVYADAAPLLAAQPA